MHIKLRQLAHAFALFQHQSFRRAAEAEHISQPALSRSIRSLEDSLGVLLFDRQTSDIAPTVFGQALLNRAETILVEAAELEREMQLLQGLDIGRLSLSMGLYAAEVSGDRALADLLAAHPNLRVQVRLRHWRDVEHLVRERQVDIGFGEIAHLKNEPELRVEPVGHHEGMFFCRPGHPILSKDKVTEDDLDAYPWASPPIPSRISRMFPNNCLFDEVTGYGVPPILVEDLTTMRSVVARTDALGTATPIQLEDLLEKGEIGIVPFRASWLRLDYGFIFLNSRSLSPAALAFMERVRQIERDLAEKNRVLLEKFCPDPRPGLSLAASS